MCVCWVVCGSGAALVNVEAGMDEHVWSSIAGCACVHAHLYARASLQWGGTMFVVGASSVTVSGGSTIANSTAQDVRRSVAVGDSCMCVCVCLCAFWLAGVPVACWISGVGRR